jgi:hypothetical protein
MYIGTFIRYVLRYLLYSATWCLAVRDCWGYLHYLLSRYVLRYLLYAVEVMIQKYQVHHDMSATKI